MTMAEETGSEDGLSDELDRISKQGDFTILFQPIVSLKSAELLGYEALTRGPPNSRLHSPLVLFDVAARLGRLVQFEQRVIRETLRQFTKLRLPGLLFLNVTADTMIGCDSHRAPLRSEIADAGLPPSRIIVELTETRPVVDRPALDAAIEGLRQIGLVMALDDLGEGFSSLKRWSEMRPGFVKVDRYFVEGIHRDPLRRQFIKSFLDVAVSCSCGVIAEGLEEEADLRVLQRLGVLHCQGFLLGRPSANPVRNLRPELIQLIEVGSAVGMTNARVSELYVQSTTAGQLARHSHTVSPDVSCSAVIELFRQDPRLYSIPVLDSDTRPIGMLRSMDVLARASDRYFLDLNGRKSCTKLMDPAPLIFDASTTLRMMSNIVSGIDARHMIDGFLVTQAGRYMGTGRFGDLVKAISDLQLFSARYANPLTLLPGNVPIEDNIEALLRRNIPFAVVYWDLNDFKPFNDVYGYRAGDEVIQFTARTLTSVIDDDRDFLGHVGGDDFISIFCSQNWEERVREALYMFDEGIVRHLREEDRAAGGYTTENRQGQKVWHPLLTLAAGVLPVEPYEYESHSQIAYAASSVKKLAKQMSGSAYFVERRKPRSVVGSVSSV